MYDGVDRDYLITEAVSGGRPSAKGWVRANCPLCEYREGKADRKHSLGYNVKTRWFECYRCGAKGKLRESPDEFAGFGDDEVEEAPPLPPVELPEGFYLLTEDTVGSYALSAAWRFLLDVRKMTVEEVVGARLGACLSGRFYGRVIIPVYDEHDKLAWFVARYWEKKCDRPYLYPIGDRHGIMFNHAALHVETDVPLLVMEGGFDAIPFAPDAVGALGKVTDERVVEAVSGLKRPVVFVPDGDEYEAGYAAALHMRLNGHRAGAIRLAPKIDPDEIFPRARLREAAVASLDVFDPVSVE